MLVFFQRKQGLPGVIHTVALTQFEKRSWDWIYELWPLTSSGINMSPSCPVLQIYACYTIVFHIFPFDKVSRTFRCQLPPPQSTSVMISSIPTILQLEIALHSSTTQRLTQYPSAVLYHSFGHFACPVYVVSSYLTHGTETKNVSWTPGYTYSFAPLDH